VVRPLRIIHFTGPGDVVGTFEHWKRGEHDPSEVSVTYSSQFFDVCARLNARAWLVGCHSQRKSSANAGIRVEHRPVPWMWVSGARYHLGQLWNGIRMAASAARFDADVAVVGTGTHWFLLAALRLFGVRILPTLHNTLWSRAKGPPHGLRAALDARFFRRSCVAVLVASDEIGRQVGRLTGGRHAPIVEFLPTYQRSTFDGIRPLDSTSSPFRILYLGRITRDKGLFDLLEACRDLVGLGLDVRFDVCGSGPALGELESSAAALGLDQRFVCHGHCKRAQVRSFLESCHVVVAPSRSTFAEGFAMTVVEGVLAGRPVITSAVCPALGYVRSVAVEVPPDSAAGYRDALRALIEDRGRLARLGEATQRAGDVFFDPAAGWGGALEYVLRRLARPTAIRPVSWLPENRKKPGDSRPEATGVLPRGR
jgi:glycogen synthase